MYIIIATLLYATGLVHVHVPLKAIQYRKVCLQREKEALSPTKVKFMSSLSNIRGPQFL